MLVGETAREIGLLVLVFAPLDALFQSGGLSWTFVILPMVLALIFVVVGIIIETWEARI